MGSALPVKPSVSQWYASLSLHFARRPNGCRLMRADRHGPLSVQRPFYPEGPELAHSYILHPPGGLVSGDRLNIAIHTETGSRALITTPGAGRAYRARESHTRQQQRQHLYLADNASLEWLPMETIVYPGAELDSHNDFYLEGSARLIAWDVVCLGLPASQAPFTHGEFIQRSRVFHNGRLSLLDRFALRAPDPLQCGAAGLNGHSVIGLMLAGPFDSADELDALIDALRLQSLPLAMTRLREWLIIRYLGDSAFSARQAFVHAWAQVRPALLQRPACAPRIWAT